METCKHCGKEMVEVEGHYQEGFTTFAMVHKETHSTDCLSEDVEKQREKEKEK